MMEDALNNARKAMGTAEYWARMWYKTQVNGVYEGNQLRIHSWIQVKFELDNIEKAMIVAAVGSELNAIDNEVWLGSKRMEECNGRTDFFLFVSWLCRSILEDAGLMGIPFHTKVRCG